MRKLVCATLVAMAMLGIIRECQAGSADGWHFQCYVVDANGDPYVGLQCRFQVEIIRPDNHKVGVTSITVTTNADGLAQWDLSWGGGKVDLALLDVGEAETITNAGGGGWAEFGGEIGTYPHTTIQLSGATVAP